LSAPLVFVSFSNELSVMPEALPWRVPSFIMFPSSKERQQQQQQQWCSADSLGVVSPITSICLKMFASPSERISCFAARSIIAARSAMDPISVEKWSVKAREWSRSWIRGYLDKVSTNCSALHRSETAPLNPEICRPRQ
jgi:hypothetical protein